MCENAILSAWVPFPAPGGPNIIILTSCIVCSTQVSGTVKNLKLEPILYANVYIENTFDGDDTDENGNFVFLTEL